MNRIKTNVCVLISGIFFSLHGMDSETTFVSTDENQDTFQFDTLVDVDNQFVDKVYAMAQKEIHHLVRALKTDISPDAYMRPILFTGFPGTGKTTLARVVPIMLNKSLKEILLAQGCCENDIQKRCNSIKESNNVFCYKYINASEFGNHYQHSKSHDVKKFFHKILETGKYCIVVVDEVNALFAGQKNETSSQAYETALALKHILERLEKSKRILTIFTTNYPEQIPQKYGLREWFMHGNVVHFDQPDRKKQQMAMEYHFKKNNNITLNIAENDLEQYLTHLDGWSFRRVAALCNEVIQNACIENMTKPTVTMKVLQNAFDQLNAQYKTIQFNHEEISEQERFCNENLALQEEFHRSQLKSSQKNINFDRNHHNLQMILQVRSNNINHYNGGLSDKERFITDYICNPETSSTFCRTRDLANRGDSNKALPEHIKHYIDKKIPVPSLEPILYNPSHEKEKKENK